MVQTATINHLKNTLFNVFLWRMWKASSYRNPSAFTAVSLPILFIAISHLPRTYSLENQQKEKGLTCDWCWRGNK